jgi:putative SOS response-associated peptidase YedK
MPVILPQSLWAEWLDPENHDTDRLGQLLLPAGDEVLTVHPVSTEVNNARNNGPDLIKPTED